MSDEQKENQATFDMRVFAAYVDCALWSGLLDEEQDKLYEEKRRNANSSDIAKETLQKMAEDVHSFLTLIREKTFDGTPIIDSRDELKTPEFIGHNFWLTRNRHGAGFWDSGMGQIGAILTVWAHAYSEYSLYIGDDNQIHGA